MKRDQSSELSVPEIDLGDRWQSTNPSTAEVLFMTLSATPLIYQRNKAIYFLALGTVDVYSEVFPKGESGKKMRPPAFPFLWVSVFLCTQSGPVRRPKSRPELRRSRRSTSRSTDQPRRQPQGNAVDGRDRVFAAQL